MARPIVSDANQKRRCTPALFAMRSPARSGHTLIEVMVAIAILTVVLVFVTMDMTNIASSDSATDRTIEISSANYLLGVIKSDPKFWDTDWSSGPSEPCLAPLGPYTDSGPSPNPSWHAMPSPPAGCAAYPFTDQGDPQPVPSGATPAPPVGDEVEYMWNASEHQGDPFAADLTVWVRRDESSPAFVYHAIRYEYPSSSTPTPEPSASSGTPTPTPCPTNCVPTPTPTPKPTPKPTPSHSPTPKPSPTPIGI